MKTRGRRQEYAQATRRALVEAAVEVFGEAGYAGGSVDAVAVRARVTKGAVYHHFANKEALFGAVVEELEAAAAARLQELVEGEGDPRGRLLAALRAVLEAASDPTYARLVLEEARVRGGREGGPLLLALEGVLASLVRDGTLQPVPVPLLAEILWGAAARAGVAVARADEPTTQRRTAGALLLRLVAGLETKHNN